MNRELVKVIANNQIEDARFLISKGVDVEYGGNYYIKLAMRNNRPEIVDMLIKSLEVDNLDKLWRLAQIVDRDTWKRFMISEGFLTDKVIEDSCDVNVDKEIRDLKNIIDNKHI